MKIRTIFLWLCLAGWPVLSFSQRTYGGAKPNIILLVADDLGYGDLGCYGQQKFATPNLDALATGGMRFTQFYAGTSVCAPSRASLMTGKHTGHTAVRGNRRFQPEGQFPLPEGTVTIAHLLQELGYTTAAFGKWGLGFPGSSGVPDKMGFEEFYGYICQTQAHDYYPDHLWHNGNRIDWSANLQADSMYSADDIHAQALAFIETPREQPFFLYLPYTLPHAALQVPHDSVYHAYRQQFNEAPVPAPGGTDYAHHHEPYPHAAYAAMVARLDRQVGEIRRKVKEAGLENNTLIIFTSDNGPHREGGGDPVFFNSSGGLRGIKRDLYEGGIRVPAIFYWKNTIAPKVTTQPGAFWDLMPTLLDLAGLPMTSLGSDGISLTPTLLHKRGAQPQHDFFYWEFHENNGRQALRMGPWKLVLYNAGGTAPDTPQLFHLEKDPAETNNLAAANPRVVADMMDIIRREHVYDKEWPLLQKEKQ